MNSTNGFMSGDMNDNISQKQKIKKKNNKDDKDKKEDILDEEIEKLIEQRTEAKKNKNFQLADEIRQQLLDKGIVLEDTRQGVKWKRA